MYNIPLDGLKMNALLQYALLKDESLDDCRTKLDRLTGRATKGQSLYGVKGGGWSNVPATIEDLSKATELSKKEIGKYLLDAQLEMTSSSLNYKTIFIKNYLIAYQLNERKDLHKDDIARRAMDSILSDYANKFSRSEELPEIWGNEATFNIMNWVINDIQMTFGRKYCGNGSMRDYQGFKIALNLRKEEIGSLQTPKLDRTKPLKADFANLIRLANSVDAMCCGVMQDSKLNIFYRFVDIMALREIARMNGDEIDYDGVYVEKFEQGEQNEKLYRYEEYAVKMPTEPDINKGSRVEFIYNCDSVETKGAQDKNMKKMFYKLFVQKMFECSYLSVYDLLTTVNGYYSKLVFDYKAATDSSNSVTLLVDSANIIEFTQEFQESLSQPTEKYAPDTEWQDEYNMAFTQVLSDLNAAIIDTYSKNNGISQRILSDAAISQLLCVAELVAVVEDIEPKMLDEDVSWRSLRKLYKELSDNGQILIEHETTITDLYCQLQFKKASRDMSDIVYDEEIQSLTPVFQREKIGNLISLIKFIEDPKSVKLSNYVGGENLSSEDIFEGLSKLVNDQHGTSLPRLLLDLKSAVEYLYVCVEQYDRESLKADPRHRISSLFALLFDRKIAETNIDIARLKESFVTNFAPQTKTSGYISKIIDRILSNADYEIPFCLKQSVKLIQQDTQDEEKLNEILEEVLRSNPTHISVVGMLSTLTESPVVQDWLLGEDNHYRYSLNGRLVIKPLGERTWGILTAANAYTRVVINGDNTWEIPRDNSMSEQIPRR